MRWFFEKKKDLNFNKNNENKQRQKISKTIHNDNNNNNNNNKSRVESRNLTVDSNEIERISVAQFQNLCSNSGQSRLSE